SFLVRIIERKPRVERQARLVHGKSRFARCQCKCCSVAVTSLEFVGRCCGRGLPVPRGPASLHGRHLRTGAAPHDFQPHCFLAVPLHLEPADRTPLRGFPAARSAGDAGRGLHGQ
ncbi:unnamed protein product, partial [Effrenium voratum]